MTDVVSILDTFGPGCCVCGKPGADSFQDEATLDRLVSQTGRVMMPNGPAIRFGGAGIRELTAADLQLARPVHRRCADPGQECGDCAGGGEADGGMCPRCKGTGRWSVWRSLP